MRPLRIILVMLALVLAGNSDLYAQTAEEIMDKHIAAIGGDNWNKVKSTRTVSTMMAAGAVMEVTETVVKGKGVRSDIMMGGVSGGYEIVTPTAGWKLDLMGGNGKVTEMSAEEVKANQDHLDPTDDYIGYKAKGIKAEYAGKEDIDGKPCHKLRVTGKDGITKSVFFDGSSYYKVRETEIVQTANGPMDVTTVFSNFKRFPEGIVVAMKAKNDYIDLTVKEVEINKTIDDSVFRPTE